MQLNAQIYMTLLSLCRYSSPFFSIFVDALTNFSRPCVLIFKIFVNDNTAHMCNQIID